MYLKLWKRASDKEKVTRYKNCPLFKTYLALFEANQTFKINARFFFKIQKNLFKNKINTNKKVHCLFERYIDILAMKIT